jgi:LysR family nitrogen assimilation transcriptional regulator
MARTGVTLNIRAEADDHSIIRAMIRAGIGYTLLTQGAFELDRQHGTVAAVRFGPRAYWPLAIVRATGAPQGAPQGASRSDILDRFHETIREAARDLARTGAWPCVLIDR